MGETPDNKTSQQGRYPTLAFFAHAHLPPHLARISAPLRDVAFELLAALEGTAHPEEVCIGLRKLLEAKDCFVRATLP